MPEIQVVFPYAEPESTAKTTPEVLAPIVVTHERERITWLFYNCDPRIQFAEIEFADQGHKFFVGTRGPGHKFKKGISGNGDIYGDVPKFNASRPVRSKYTVRGYRITRAGTEKCCSEADPEIIVNEP